MKCAVKTVCIALPTAFPKLPATQDDSQHSRLICLLVALLEAVGFRPTTGRSYIHVR